MTWLGTARTPGQFVLFCSATLVIFVLMALLFRSLRIGLLSMIPNLIPLAITVGVMGYAGITLRTSTVIIFSVSFSGTPPYFTPLAVSWKRRRTRSAESEFTEVLTPCS